MLEFFSGCDSEDLYEFSTDLQINPFGAELARVASYTYENIDDAIDDITYVLSERGIEVDEDDVYGFFSGELLPSEAALEVFAELCVDDEGEVDMDDWNRLLSSAEQAYDLAEDTAAELGLLDDSVEEGVEPYYEDEYEEDEGAYEDGEEYYYDDEDEYEDEDYVDPETEELRNTVESLTTRQVLSDNLDQITEYARDLVDQGKLPPIAFSALLGEVDNTSSSRFAEFSSVCDEEEVSGFDQLDRIQFCLSVFDQCGPLMNFSNYAPEDFSSEPNLDYQEEAIVEGMVNLYRDA